MNMRSHLVRVSDCYREAAGLSRSRVSTIVLNRGSTLDRIAAGQADVTTTTFENAMLWFSVNWPDGMEWPKGVHRPVVCVPKEAAE
ncbi:hypothetical protein C5748_16255 [Phyllobacterium phragmitis]|uniref:Uncharacterized protein n=1 Tax=Phyllobacterium phragmitis TaxID=2670329 RepID=A0A2S9IPQ5_9HYPH|nr:hypothetical protein [Phyllobacterium phragmitis]PRD42472.1 hypothetical protein C5748_16255 [Phyllobacterium phragmitis]